MNRLFYSNFDCEYQWAAPEKIPPLSVRRRNHELFAVWLSVADEKDILLSPDGVEPFFWEEVASAGLAVPQLLLHSAPQSEAARIGHGTECVPWGWTSSAVRTAQKMGCQYRSPGLDIIRLLNSRRFSHQLEQEWRCGLPLTAQAESLQALRNAISFVARRYEKWIIKAEWGMAGREQICGAGETLSPAAEQWAVKRLRRKLALFVEPQVEIVQEVGVQFLIPTAGPPQLEGMTPLLSSSRGQYQGSRFDTGAEAPYRAGTIETRYPGWHKAREMVLEAARQMQARGYFGPAGIDAACYRLPDGTIGWRPLQDINARLTMGQLSLGFRRYLKPGEWGYWLHQRWPAESADLSRRRFEHFRHSLPAESRCVRTAPFLVENETVSLGSVLVMGKDSDHVSAFETARCAPA